MPVASLNAIIADKEGGVKSKGSIKRQEEMNPGKSMTHWSPLFQLLICGLSMGRK
jgi:hypothetical protein